MVSWYKCLIVNLVFSPPFLEWESFPDRCLLEPFFPYVSAFVQVILYTRIIELFFMFTFVKRGHNSILQINHL